MLKHMKAAVLAVGAIATVGLFLLQWQAANREPNVAVVVDGQALAWYAADREIAYVDLLQQVRQVGVNAVAISEEDLASLAAAGHVTYATGAEVRQQAALAMPAWLEDVGILVDGYTYVQVSDSAWVTAMQERLGELVRPVGLDAWEIAYAADKLAGVTFGFDPERFAAVQEAGLAVVPRPATRPQMTEADVRALFQEIDELAPDAKLMIFRGSVVPGHPEAMAQTAAALQERGMVLGLVEQASGQGYIVQLGQEDLAARLDYRVERVSLRPDGLEWGARVLYLRPSEQPIVELMLKGLGDQVAAVEAAGFRPGLPGGYEPIGRIWLLMRWPILVAVGLLGFLALWHVGGRVAWARPLATVPVVVATLSPRLDPAAVAVGIIAVAGTYFAGELDRHWRAAAIVSAALGAGLIATLVQLHPALVLGLEPRAAMLPALLVALPLGAVLALADSGGKLDLRRPVRLSDLAAWAALATAGLILIATPAWAPVLVGAAPLAGRGPAWRWPALAVAAGGALAFGLAPHLWLPLLVGVGAGILGGFAGGRPYA